MHKVWDSQTAEELALKSGLEVEGFSTVECDSLQEAIKLLKLAGFSQPRNPPYWWENGEKIAITNESGSITFRRQPTPQEAKIIEQRDKEWREHTKKVLSRQRFNEDESSIFEHRDNQGAYRMWDTQTAEEFANEFEVEVKSFSTVECGNLRTANKLLRDFGFWQKSNYHWELGRKQAITHENGEVVFRPCSTPEERRIRQEKHEEHLKKCRELHTPKKKKGRW